MNSLKNQYALPSFIIGIFFIVGIIFFLFFQRIVFVSMPTTWSIPSKPLVAKKSLSLTVWDGAALKKQSTTLVAQSTQDLLTIAIKEWLLMVGQEIPSLQNIQLQCCILDSHQQSLYLSFDHSLLPASWSIEQKILLIESLQQTIKPLCSTLQEITYLVHHTPLADEHLLCLLPWPVDGFVSATQEPLATKISGNTIIIDHSGDERTPGRIIKNNFEHHLTNQIEDALVYELSHHNKLDATPLRRNGEWYDLQKKRQLLNRLQPNLCIHLCAYPQPERSLPTIHIYYHCNHPIKDKWFNKALNTWINTQQAHCRYLDQTMSTAWSLYTTLLKEPNLHWHIKKPCSIPSTLTFGIQAPMIIIELGLPTTQSWKSIIKPLAAGINALLLP